MESQEIAQIVNLYREQALVPSPAQATVINFGSAIIQVCTEWTQRDLEKNEKVRSIKNYLLDSASLQPITVYHPIDTVTEQLSCLTQSGDLRAVLRKFTNKKGEEKQLLEIWKGSGKIKNIDLLSLEKHGKVYEDNQFGTLTWSKSSNQLLFVAEKKRPKPESFFKLKLSELSCEDGEPKASERLGQGEEFTYLEDWGETLVSKHHPVLCVYSLKHDELKVLEGLPDDISPGQCIWLPDDSGVICVGWNHEPRRLGLTYCTNRRSALYHLQLGNTEYGYHFYLSVDILGSNLKSVYSPRFSPDGSKLVYLENEQGGPHHQGSKLMMCTWPSKKISVVVDLVHEIKGDEFPGIYSFGLPKRIWSKDSSRVIFHSYWRSKQELLCIDVNTRTITRLTNDPKIGCWTLLDIHDDIIIATCSSPDLKPHLVAGRLPPSGSEQTIQWNPLDKEDQSIPEVKWNIFSISPSPDLVNPDFENLTYEVILLKPALKELSEKLPTIVWPHGGPHSSHTAMYGLYPVLFVKLGYACLLINFRGSTGFGESNLKSLPKNIGTQDIKDCQFAVEHLSKTEELDLQRLLLFGGSHGGFIVAHMIGQYPGLYKACVCRNPVTDIGAKQSVTDIPDWGWVEIGLNYDFRSMGDPSVLTAMWERSPIKYINQVKTPTLILMGKCDLRVPPSQSLLYYNALKARHVPVRLNAYEDNHSLSKVDTEADVFVHTVNWFQKYLDETSHTSIKSSH